MIILPAVTRAQAFVGMVHYPGSPRHLDLTALAKLAACSAAISSNAPDRVLLSVDISGETFQPLIEAGHPDLLQLHGNETPDHVAAIKARFGLPIIKSIPLKRLTISINAPIGMVWLIGYFSTRK